MGTAAQLGMWMPVEATLADRFDVVSFDYRGLGDSERGDGPITVATLAEDAHALLDALSIPPGACPGLGATFELMTGTGASHGLMFERTDDFVRTVLTFLEQHPLE
jgi:alpha/beta hydrolase fold